ncbi:MAG TPA: CBS domain-containing protein [Candidatus Polarisedimenticolaceae bacterium]|nr:CBS domain-containing protein [Candidatus Polarisedimenticolaceae bacterium]
MRLQEIMSRDVETVRPDEPAARAYEIMRFRRIRHLVVVERSNVVGIVSDRDLGGPRGASLRKDRRVHELMTPQVVSAKLRTTVKQAANLLRGRNLGCLPILEDGKLRGIVTTSDLLELLGRGLERPVVRARRWTLRHRGVRPRSAAAR